MSANNNDIERKLADIAGFLEAQKAIDPAICRLASPNALADVVIIATASSRRHAQGLAQGLLSLCKERGHEFLRMEGFEAAQWILVDCNDVIAHILLDDARSLYRLEDLFRPAPQKESNE